MILIIVLMVIGDGLMVMVLIMVVIGADNW